MINPCARVSLAILINLVLFQPSFAADTSRVSLSLPENNSVSAGQRYSFSITLLAVGQFDGPTYFDLPEIDGAVIMQVSERPIFGTEQVNGASYVSASFEFAVFAQRGGRLSIPPITARFGSKSAYNQPAVQHKLQTKSFKINVAAPPGFTAGEVIVSSNEFNVTQTWSPEPGEARVGDAITRTISISAQEVPAMLLPSTNFSKVKGLAIYPKSPQLNDKTDRGVFTGERIDTVTYILEQAGSIEIPELSLRWWDSSLEQWQSKTFPAVTLTVADNPALDTQSATSSGVSKTAFNIRSRAGWTALLITLVVALILSARPLGRKLQAWRQQRAASEAAQWKRLRNVCQGGSASDVYRELNQWLSHYGMSSARLTADVPQGVSDALRANCIAMQRQLVGLNAQWSVEVFSDELNKLRQNLRSSNNAKTVRELAPLNPA